MSSAGLNETLMRRPAQHASDSEDAATRHLSEESPQDCRLDSPSTTPRLTDSTPPDRTGVEHSRLGSVRQTRVMKSLTHRWRSPDHHEMLDIRQHVPGSLTVHWLG